MSIYYAPKITVTRLSLLIASALLTACASSPSSQPSLIPAETVDITRKDGVFTQPLARKITKPGCKGECPTLQMDSLVFPGNTALTQYVDQQLAQMMRANEGDGTGADYSTVDGFVNSYWKNAAARDEAQLYAKPRYRNKDLTVLELGVGYYATGAAHGTTRTQFVNWDNKAKKPLAFTEVVKSNQQATFNNRVQQAYMNWLKKQDLNEMDFNQYLRVWPFQPSENIALTDAGVVVKYNSYELAPYSSGQPELLITYPQLQGILQPLFLPN